MNGVCILCNSRSHKKLYKINKYTILKCNKCALIFTSPLPSKKDLQELYTNYRFETGFLNEHLIRVDARRVLRTIQKRGYKNGKLLDLGSGAGFLLDEARHFGFKTTGVEIGAIPYEYAKKQLHLNVFRKNFDTFHTKEKFQIVTLIQVIEHITNPFPLLYKVYSLLDDRGIVCIATPNINSWLSRVLKDKFNYLIPPEHVLYYSPKTLKLVLEKVGFTVIKITTYGYPEDVGGIYRALRSKKEIKEDRTTTTRDIPAMGAVPVAKQSAVAKIKYYVFENVFRNFAYPFLNIGLNGSMIEIYAIKS